MTDNGTHHEHSAPRWQNQNGRGEAAINRRGKLLRAMCRHSNAPAGVWNRSWNYAALCKNVTKPYATGETTTAYEMLHGKPFDFRRLKPFGCYVARFIKKEEQTAGKNADRAKPGIFVGYGHNEGYSACLVLDPKTRKVAKVPFEPCKFYPDEFPWCNPKGQGWPPLEINDTPDDFTAIEEGDIMVDEDSEPYVREGPRTRARVAAEEILNQQTVDQNKIQEEKRAVTDQASSSEKPGVTEQQDELAEAQRAIMEGTSVYFDEAAVVFCGHDCTGDELHPDILPDPRTWAEAMDQPDWQEWVEASKTERRNLRKRKTY